MTKATIFDCFGVVQVDSFDATFKYFGGDLGKDRQFILETLELSTKGILPDGSAPVFAKHVGVSTEEWRKKLTSLAENDMELLNYAKELRKKYRVGMLSNIGKGGLKRFFEPGFLEQYFDEVIGSGDIGFAKPEAQAYEIAADRLGVRLDECIFIDDRQDYVDGAQAVGMKTILYKNFKDFKTQFEKLLV